MPTHPETEVPEGYTYVEFTANITDMNEVTRAVDPDGLTLNNMTLFCFNEFGLYISSEVANLTTYNEDSGHFTPVIPNNTQIIHFIGNHSEGLFDESEFPGQTESMVIANMEGGSGMLVYWSRFAMDVNSSKPIDEQLADLEFEINGNKYKTFNFSELNSELNFEWDSRTYKNANYVISVTVSDETGNRSESKEISLTTNNENLPPVAKITGSGKVGKGTEKTYKATSSYDPNGKVTSYKWEVSGGATIKSGASQDTVVVAFPDSETTCTITLTFAINNSLFFKHIYYFINTFYKKFIF